jgi:putative inorganic carbon (hco3(-)) transporter
LTPRTAPREAEVRRSPVRLTLLAVAAGGLLGLLAASGLPLIAVAAMFALPAVAAAFAQPRLGLYLLVFMVYARVSDVLIEFHGLPSVFQPMLGFLVLVILARWLLFDERPRGLAQTAGLLGGYGFVLCLSLFYARDAAIAQDAIAGYARDAVVVLIIVTLLRTERSFRGVIWTLIGVGAFLGTISAYQYLTGDLDNAFGGFGQADVLHVFDRVEDYRVSGPIADPNHYAQLLLVIVPLALGRARFAAFWWQRGIALWALLAVVAAIVFTLSRGALLALALVVALAFLARRPRPLTVIAVAAALVVAVPLLPSGYTERVSALIDVAPGGSRVGEASLQGRLSALGVGLDMFADNPLLGVGVGQFPVRYREHARPLGLDASRVAVEPHNLYVEQAAETGAIGLLAFGLIIFVVFRNTHLVRATLRRAGEHDLASVVGDVRLGILGYLVAGLFLHNAYPRFLWVILGVALATPNLEVFRRASSEVGG